MVHYKCKECSTILTEETNRYSGVKSEWCDDCITNYWSHIAFKDDEQRLYYLIDTAMNTEYEDFSTALSDNFKNEQETETFWRKINHMIYDEIDSEGPSYYNPLADSSKNHFMPVKPSLQYYLIKKKED